MRDRFRGNLIKARVFFRPTMITSAVCAVCLRRHDWQHLKATYIGFDTRGNETAGSRAFNHQKHFFILIPNYRANDYLVNDVLIGSCDPLSSKPFRRPEMSAFNSSTTMDEVIGRLHGCPTRSIDGLVSNLPGDHRGNLAVFCYGRAHLHEASLAIAATCNLDALVHAGGKSGAFLFEQSRRPPETDHIFSRARRVRISLERAAAMSS